MSDPVNHPPHYQHPSGVECIEIVEHLGFCLGNAIKYLFRAGKKDVSVQDLKKAAWYLEREIAHREKHGQSASGHGRSAADAFLRFCDGEPDGHVKEAIAFIWGADRAFGHGTLALKEAKELVLRACAEMSEGSEASSDRPERLPDV